jgi:hypothetical protein
MMVFRTSSTLRFTFGACAIMLRRSRTGTLGLGMGINGLNLRMGSTAQER